MHNDVDKMVAKLPFPPEVSLAQRPTPLVRLQRLSARLGVELLAKRDDMTGVELSGNKVRKLEFLLADALRREASGLITCGGAQSNHARATALSAARFGLSCHLLLRVDSPAAPPPTTANLLLDRLAGATIEWISPEQYVERDDLMARAAERLPGRQVVLPEGGSNALGAWGYVRCMCELAFQLGAKRRATIVYPVGSGGTAAGLIAGVRLLDLPYRLIGVCVAADATHFRARISAILEQMSDGAAVELARGAEIELWDSYVGRGYALSRREEREAIVELVRLEGLVTDPVYTGKAYYGMLTELRRGSDLPQPIVFLHTGGIFGMFADPASFEEFF